MLAALAGRIYDHAPQQNAVPLGARPSIPMASTDAVLARSLDDLDEQLDRGEPPYVRIRCVDGRHIEGELLDVGEAGLVIFDIAARTETPLPSDQLLALEVRAPRRIRQWVLALCAMPLVTALLVGFSRIPGVEPEGGDITIGFMLVMAAVWALGRIPALRKLFYGQLTTWVRAYPPRGA